MVELSSEIIALQDFSLGASTLAIIAPAWDLLVEKET